MSQEFNPNSIDATLARIEQKLDSHVTETREYRQRNDAKHDTVIARVTELEGDRKKLLGIAIGSGLGAGGVGAALGKLFGSH